jgi:hypothetical protein
MKPIERAEMNRFPPSTLYDIARNENARWEARKHAYLLLLDRAHPLAKHENLQQLAYMVADEIMTIKTDVKPDTAATSEGPKFPNSANLVQNDVPDTNLDGESPEAAEMEHVSEEQALEFAREQADIKPDTVSTSGPFTAGFTTKNQLQDEVLPTVDIK